MFKEDTKIVFEGRIREFDLVRALAVLSIILFHLPNQAFRFAYLGVDIFFVLSGYFMARYILRELHLGNFQLLHFYKRRIRRLAPPLIVMLAVSTFLAPIFLSVYELKDYFQSLVASLLLISNFWFMREVNYFDTDAFNKPLIHMWSLSLEEQFWMLLPLVLIVLFRRSILFLGLSAMFLLSLFFFLTSNGDAASSFYLLHTRAWEFVIGALIPFLVRLEIVRSFFKLKNFILNISILFLIFLLFSSIGSVLGSKLVTFLAVLITFIISLCIVSGASFSFLGKGVFCGIGKSSYSLYLWHQPIIVFSQSRFLDVTPTSLSIQILMIATTGFVSYFVIEKRLLLVNVLSKKQNLACLISSMLLICVGSFGHFRTSFFFGTSDLALRENLEARVEANLGINSNCDQFFVGRFDCVTGVEPSFVLWGDSYAMHLASALNTGELGQFAQVTKSSCPPVIETSPINQYVDINQAKLCIDSNERFLRYLKSQRIRTVVASSPFFSLLDPSSRFLTSNGIQFGGWRLATQQIDKTLEEFKRLGVRLIIVSPPPQNGKNIGRCLYKAYLLEARLDSCDLDWGDVLDFHGRTIRWLTYMENTRDLKVIFLHDFLCDIETCISQKDGLFIYRDSGHLSREGASVLREFLSSSILSDVKT